MDVFSSEVTSENTSPCILNRDANTAVGNMTFKGKTFVFPQAANHGQDERCE